jgi:hypothetical protein
MGKRNIREAIESLAATKNKDIVSLILCEVVSFDPATQTCECTPVGGDLTTNIPSVNMKASANDGVLIIPTVGSEVIVAQSSKTMLYYIFMHSNIDSMEIVIPGTPNPTKLKIQQGKITFNDGSFDGLIKITDLITKLNNLESKVNTIVSTFNAHFHPGVTVGVGSTLVYAAPIVGALTPTVKADIENPLIIHGQ